MGGKSSKETAEIHANGQVNNNVVVQEHVEIWKDGRVLLFALVILKIFEIAYIIYKNHIRAAKKQALRNDRIDKA